MARESGRDSWNGVAIAACNVNGLNSVMNSFACHALSRSISRSRFAFALSNCDIEILSVNRIARDLRASDNRAVSRTLMATEAVRESTERDGGNNRFPLSSAVNSLLGD